MVVDCAAVETGCMLKKYIKYFSPSPLLLLSFASILLLLLLRRDLHFCFLVEVLLLLIIFLVGCATAAAGTCAAYNISTEAERGTGYCFFLLRFCPLHCDASVMVVDCAAVETRCMLEKYVTSPLLLLSFASILLLLLLWRRDLHFYFLVEVLLLLIIFIVGCRWCLCCLQHQ